MWMIFPLLSLLSMVQAQYYNAPMMTGSGCVATGNKLYSHGNHIRELNGKEMVEMEKYKRELLEWKQRVEDAYARLELVVHQNQSSLPVIPPRPPLPAFCTSNQTTLYILAGCTVQNHKVYIAGKFARELTEKEKSQLDEFARQVLVQQAQQQQMAESNSTAANATAHVQGPQSKQSTVSTPSTTTVSPTSDIGRQIALDFCMEF